MASSCWIRTTKRRLELGLRPWIMGIVNVTPDSFSDGGQFVSVKAAVAQAHQLVQEGADIIDIGGESTRPGATEVSAEEECRRVLPVVRLLAQELEVPLSIDTTKAEVARACVEAGAEMINDISGGKWDEGMFPLVVETQAAYVLTHCQGRPAMMQERPFYGKVVSEVYDDLLKQSEAMIGQGVRPEQLIVDPGIGFGKTFEHNMELVAQGATLAKLGYPVLLGLSRKSLIRRLFGETPEALSWGSVALHCLSFWQGGGKIWRAHEVGAMRQAAELVALFESYQKKEDL